MTAIPPDICLVPNYSNFSKSSISADAGSIGEGTPPVLNGESNAGGLVLTSAVEHPHSLSPGTRVRLRAEHEKYLRVEVLDGPLKGILTSIPHSAVQR